MKANEPILDDWEPDEVDAFSASLAPVNQTHPLLFSTREKFCCLCLAVGAMTLMRVLLAN